MNIITKSELVKLLSAPLAKRVDQKAIERWSVSLWAHLGPSPEPAVSVPRLDKEKSTFTMMLPPPNVTGNLHLGHALTVAIQDALIRQRRMSQLKTTWIPGFDHAGLATQNVVDKLLFHKTGKTRTDIGREEFIKFANQWKDAKKNEMKGQLDLMGLKLNHEREFFTTDQKSSLAVHHAFKQLFNEGLLYRATKLVHWSSILGTTLSDIEVVERDGKKIFERTGEVVETRSIPQWFVSAHDMARRSMEVINDASIKMIPPNYKRTWSSWLLDNGVQDWCVSRQSWWGHRIPSYKKIVDPDHGDNWIVADNLSEAANMLKCPEGDIEQDSDVLDTWFSSALLPLSIAGWPDKRQFATNSANGIFPLDIMETGFDILTFWVAKMVMMSLALEEKIPFKMILLHGMICDSHGKKMSKSRGNVINPSDVIAGATLDDLQERTKSHHSQGILDKNNLDIALQTQKKLFPNGIPECGADGLRAYLLSQDFQEEVVKIQVSQLEKVRRLANKVWNLHRYVITILESKESTLQLNLDSGLKDIDMSKLDGSDITLLGHFTHCIEQSHLAFFDHYQLHKSFNCLDEFLHSKLSSDYLKLSKKHLGNSSDNTKSNYKLEILSKCLITSDKLLHPFMPHLTEFLYQKLMLCTGDLRCEDDIMDSIRSIGTTCYPQPSEWTLLEKVKHSIL